MATNDRRSLTGATARLRALADRLKRSVMARRPAVRWSAALLALVVLTSLVYWAATSLGTVGFTISIFAVAACLSVAGFSFALLTLFFAGGGDWAWLALMAIAAFWVLCVAVMATGSRSTQTGQRTPPKGP